MKTERNIEIAIVRELRQLFNNENQYNSALIQRIANNLNVSTYVVKKTIFKMAHNEEMKEKGEL